MYVLDNDLAKAEEFALSSLEYNAQNLSAKNILALVYRKMGRKDEASEVIKGVLASLPLCHGLRFENYILGNITETEFSSLLSGEFRRDEIL